MNIVQLDRRSLHKKNSSIIFDNGYTRLRVTDNDSTLGLALDARDLYGEWSTLQHSPVVRNLSAAGSSDSLNYRYHSFDPIEIHGETRGVSLRGTFAGFPLALTAMRDTTHCWCRFHFEMATVPQIEEMRLQHCWSLTPAWSEVDSSWPPQMVNSSELPGNPAAFFQLGPIFSSLVADLEEGDPTSLGLLLDRKGSLGFAFGIMGNAAKPLSSPLSFAYAICLDAHALPGFGFQQLIRFLGRNEALRLVPASSVTPVAGMLPALPTLAAGYENWLPFQQEGTTDEIVALADYLLKNAANDSWHNLEQAIGWIDRLCLHQHLCEVPGSKKFGTIGSGTNWDIAALHMPELLLRAFHYTGNAEYGYRAIAAIGALPEAKRALVLGNLRPHYGDIFLNADQGEVVLFADLEQFASTVQQDGIHLNIRSAIKKPLQLVLEGSMEAYSLIINGKRFGSIPTTTLRQGIEVMAM